MDGMETRTILIEGRNCWRIAGAGRVAFLVDGADYFAAFAASASRSRHSILAAGWDMDSRTRLFQDDLPRDLPVELGSFMDAIVSRRRGLHAYLLNWDFHAIFAFDREALPVIKWELNTHRRLHFHLDGNHPALGSHHQKIVAIDDAVAFAGGLDLTESRWDTREHRVPDPRRVTSGGESYPPFHDVMMAVDGEAAASLGELFRERWRRATGKRLRRPAHLKGDPWPPDLIPNVENARVGIARTVPARARSEWILIPAIGSAAICCAVSLMSGRDSPGSPTMMCTQIRRFPPAALRMASMKAAASWPRLIARRVRSWIDWRPNSSQT